MAAGATYTSIASFSSNGSTTSFIFGASNTLPQTYTDLVLIINDPNSTAFFDTRLIFNNDTGANYSRTGLRSISGNYAFRQTGLNSIILGSNGGSDFPRPSISHIMSYANSNVYKTVIDSEYGFSGISAQAELWRNTAPITQLEVQTSTAFTSGAIMCLYGIVAA